MGAFRYCLRCDLALNKPSAREDLIEQKQLCANGHSNPPARTLQEWLLARKKSMADISDGAIVKQYISLRDELDRRAKLRTAEDAPLVEGMQLLEGAMALRLKERGDESVRTEWGTCYQSRTLSVRTADKEVLFNYVREADAFHLLAGNLAKDAIKDHMGEHQQTPPPGVDVTFITKTLFRRA
jgi:hypothetical protein